MRAITVARKPLSEKAVSANVLKHGTGAINVDGTRIGSEVRHNAAAGNKAGTASLMMGVRGMPKGVIGWIAVGRWPANVILSQKAAAWFDADAEEEWEIERVRRVSAGMVFKKLG